MKNNRIILAGLSAVVAACLSLGQVASVYAAPSVNQGSGTRHQASEILALATTPDQTTAPATADTTAQTTTPAADTAATTGPQLPGNTTNTDTVQPTCDVPIIGWAVCPLINAGLETVNKLAGLVTDMLQVRPLVNNNSLYNAWQALRDLADVAFILVFMVLIFSTGLSINISAYQLKTLLPKLIAAAILVQFSYFISSIAVDIGNVLGAGMGRIFAQLGTTPGTSPSDIAQGISGVKDVLTIGIGALAAIIAGAILTWPVVLLFIGAMLLSVLGVFLTLAARQLIIAVLVVTSPLAFVAWILPGTEAYFKMWYKNLARVILLYPIIVVLLSIGGLLARAAQGTAGVGATGGSVQAVNEIIAALVPIIAFCSIPATFKWAGSIMDWAQSKYLMGPMSNANSRLRNSQLAKDMKATRQERGYVHQRDWATLPSDSAVKGFGKKLGRGFARAQSGQIGVGTPTRRRLAKGYDAALGAQMEDWGHIYDDQQMGNSQLMNQLVVNPKTGKVPEKFAYKDASGRVHNVSITKAMRAQAIGQIVKQGGMLEVSQMYNQVFDQNQNDHKGEFRDNWHGMPQKEVTDMWYRGLGSSGKMSEVIGSVPMVNPGKLASVYDTLSASQIANMHGSAAGFFVKRIVAPVPPNNLERQLGKTEGILRQERGQKVLDGLRGIAESRDLRAKADQTTLKRFKDAITNGKKDINPVTGAIESMYDKEFERLMQTAQTEYRGVRMSGIDFLNNHVTNDGKIQG